MQAIYPYLAAVLSFISGLFPFSLFDILTIVAVGLLLLSVVKLIQQKWKFRYWIYCFLLTLLWVVLWFYLSWGISYFRPDVYERLAMQPSKADTVELSRLTMRYIDSVNAHYVSMEELDEHTVDGSVEGGYRKLSEKLRLPYPCGSRRVKHSVYQSVQVKMGITGFFGPFFNEVHVSSKSYPASYPFTVAHEKAHQLGISSEAECNLYAILVCISTENGQVRYSGYYEAVGYLLSSVRKAAPETYRQLYRRLDERVRNDYANEHAYWQQNIHNGMAKAQQAVCDSYLKANKVSSGVGSYSEVVQLLLAWESTR